MSEKDFVVRCDFVVEADSEDDAYEQFLDYLVECVRNRDVTGFEFVERKEDKV